MRGRSKAVRLLSVFVAAACVKIIPPPPAPEQPPVQMAASFDATWNAVVETFATQHVSIQTLDKPSGLIVVTPSTVEAKDADRWASCGAIKHGVEKLKLHATDLEYNVVVRAAGTGSTIRMNVRWSSRNPTDPERPDSVICTTTNVWEAELEQRIRAAARPTPGAEARGERSPSHPSP